MSLSVVSAMTSLHEMPVRGGPDSDVNTQAAAAVGSSPVVWDRVALQQLEESPEGELGMWPQYWERERERRQPGPQHVLSGRSSYSMCLIVVRKH